MDEVTRFLTSAAKCGGRNEKMVKKRLPEEVIEYMGSLGKRGGKATGEKKRRSPEHYRKMVEARGHKVKKLYLCPNFKCLMRDSCSHGIPHVITAKCTEKKRCPACRELNT